ncbi:hypothetical protein SAMD00023353_3900600 [Rosellinia necatrix]|uniref:Infection structure specific protein n=1 Tax=Rosellinia necatrix TaxID=77044 RepID=A0A1S7UNL4_ROSNE|nr:hypothetical protein SAMD00023353_3900600 [Rosellinia necatrix]
MFNTKVLSLLALAGASLAQEEFPAPECASLASELVAAAPTIPAALLPYLDSDDPEAPPADGLLTMPDVYVQAICDLVPGLPSSVLSDFQTWGPSLLHFASVEISSYDAIITKCVTTGTAAASITSYIHSIASNPERLCQPTSTPSGSNNTASITPYPTASGNGTVPTAAPSVTSSIPTAAAARPTNIIAGAAVMGGLLGVVALL